MELKCKDVDDLCIGAAFLGAGGGGDPYIGGLMVKQELAAGRRIEIIDPDGLDDSKLIIPTAMMGAPTVLLEKIPSGEEPIRALRVVENELGRQADATMPTEVGGINSTIPLFVGARLGIPVVDADGQGRAFPELQMETFAIEGVKGCPLGISDEKGDTSLVMTDNNHRMEWIARGITIRFVAVNVSLNRSNISARTPRQGLSDTRGVSPRDARHQVGPEFSSPCLEQSAMTIQHGREGLGTSAIDDHDGGVGGWRSASDTQMAQALEDEDGQMLM